MGQKSDPAQTKPAARLHGLEATGLTWGPRGIASSQGTDRSALPSDSASGLAASSPATLATLVPTGGETEARGNIRSSGTRWPAGKGHGIPGFSLFKRGPQAGRACAPSPGSPGNPCLPAATVTALPCPPLRLGDRPAHTAVALSPISPESDLILIATQELSTVRPRSGSRTITAQRGPQRGPPGGGSGSASTARSRAEGRAAERPEPEECGALLEWQGTPVQATSSFTASRQARTRRPPTAPGDGLPERPDAVSALPFTVFPILHPDQDGPPATPTPSGCPDTRKPHVSAFISRNITANDLPCLT